MMSATNAVGLMCIELIRAFNIQAHEINLTPTFLSLRREQPGTMTLDEVETILDVVNERSRHVRDVAAGRQYFLLLRASTDG